MVLPKTEGKEIPATTASPVQPPLWPEDVRIRTPDCLVLLYHVDRHEEHRSFGHDEVQVGCARQPFREWDADRFCGLTGVQMSRHGVG